MATKTQSETNEIREERYQEAINWLPEPGEQFRVSEAPYHREVFNELVDRGYLSHPVATTGYNLYRVK